MHKKNILNNLKNSISIEKFMQLSLYGKNGYYLKSNIIGRSGDFITAPEISQLFGEIIGLYILNYWQNNINKKFNFIELGPGRGTLLLDILRITKTFNSFTSATNIKLIEKNINLIKEQKINFNKFNLNIKKIKWSKDFNNNYKEPIIVLANEFFDCFPIRQFFKKKAIWYEKMVKYDKFNKNLKLVDKKIYNQNTLDYIKKHSHSNILEISKTRDKYFEKICKNILKVGGMMIVIDYGYLEKPNNFTLQSIYNNKNSNILDNIGYQDITSLVDFKSLISNAELYNLKINIFDTQRNFLIQNGIYERAKKILEKCKKNQKNIINEGLERIINKNNMGSIYKVLIISK